MSYLQLNKLKSGTKNDTEVNLNCSSNMIGDFNDDANFPHKLLLTNTQVSRLIHSQEDFWVDFLNH